MAQATRQFEEVTPTETEVIPVQLSDRTIVTLGVALMIIGMVSILYASFSTLASVVLVGAFFVAGGAVEVWSAVSHRQKNAVFWHLLSGALFILAGILMLFRPDLTAAALTLFMAMTFIVGGLYRSILALLERWPGGGWFVFSGVLGVVLGVLIFAQWPASAFWVLGAFLGLELLFTGWALVAMARSLRRMIPQP